MVAVDVDHCADMNGGCDVHAECSEVGGIEVECTCHSGYTGDGLTCTGVSYYYYYYYY